MSDLIKIHQKVVFELEEAQELLPVIEKMTKKSVEQFIQLQQQLERCPQESSRWQELEQEIAEVLNRWSEKILSLGCVPKGIWLVDFDNGAGYYCWRYGDEKILYAHGYQEGFSGRTAI